MQTYLWKRDKIGRKFFNQYILKKLTTQLYKIYDKRSSQLLEIKI